MTVTELVVEYVDEIGKTSVLNTPGQTSRILFRYKNFCDAFGTRDPATEIISSLTLCVSLDDHLRHPEIALCVSLNEHVRHAVIGRESNSEGQPLL